MCASIKRISKSIQKENCFHAGRPVKNWTCNVCSGRVHAFFRSHFSVSFTSLLGCSVQTRRREKMQIPKTKRRGGAEGGQPSTLYYVKIYKHSFGIRVRPGIVSAKHLVSGHNQNRIFRSWRVIQVGPRCALNSSSTGIGLESTLRPWKPFREASF